MSLITVVGNLTRDPEVKFFESGTAVVGFAVAENRRYKKGEEWVDADPTYFEVRAFNGLVDNIASTLHKGDRVVVHGRLQVRHWDKDDGSIGTAVEIIADDVAPSLRWATCEITKNPKKDSNGGGKGGHGQPPLDEEPF